MHRDRVGGAARPEMGPLDRKKINDALNLRLEKSSSSAPKLVNGLERLEKEWLPNALTSYRNQQQHPNQRDEHPLADGKRSDVGSEADGEDCDVSGSDGDDTSWISWFCSLRGNEFFCEVDDEFIEDDFNLYGLRSQIPYYEYALDLVLDVESSQGDAFTDEQNEMVESAAEMLYGLVHARYILTSKGMAAMLEKYKNFDFGRCPRVFCCGQPCLPVAQSDIPRLNTVKIYCPMCEDIYYPRSKYQGNIDGAYFGTTFPHLFLMTYGHMQPKKPPSSYVPRVFGFKVHKL